jgi:hypothetical protein
MAEVEAQTIQERFFLKAIELVVLEEIAIGEIRLRSDAGICKRANERNDWLVFSAESGD